MTTVKSFIMHAPEVHLKLSVIAEFGVKFCIRQMLIKILKLGCLSGQKKFHSGRIYKLVEKI